MAAQLPSFNELLKATVEGFEKQYQSKPDLAACAPGRVNLIGEHIDYCDGFVLPMVSAYNYNSISTAHRQRTQPNNEKKNPSLQALPMVTMIVGRKNGTSNECNILTLCQCADLPKQVQFETENLRPGMPK